jgi:hypothetical protein
MSKRKKKKRPVWGDLKVGDACFVVYHIGSARELVHRDCRVLKIGREYITVECMGFMQQRFSKDTGYGDSTASLHTEKTYAEHAEREKLVAKLYHYIPWNNMPTEVLRQVTALVEEHS